MAPNLDLDGNIFDKGASRALERIADDLDVSGKWRDLVAVAGDDNKLFALDPHRVEECARQGYCGRSPTMQLFNKYSVAGMTIRHLQKYLDELGLEKPLALIKNPEPLAIAENPEGVVRVDQGGRLCVKCAATGFPYPRYVWFRGREQVTETLVTGELVVDCAGLDHAGTYMCRVHNDQVLRNKDQVKWSTPCEVRVRPGPRLTILQHPQSVAVNAREDVRLTCYTQGDDSATYAWFKDGQVIPGQCRAELNLTAVTLQQSGKYQCVVTGRWEISRSTLADVTVMQPNEPEILEQPRDSRIQLGGRASFWVRAKGRSLKYQWFHNNKPMEGQTQRRLEFPYVDDQNKQGSYQCFVENQDGKVASHLATLVVDRVRDYHIARAKVALLIGNSAYRGGVTLDAVTFDVAEGTKKFRDIGFKVLSLLDLTLVEMRKALEFFCSLLCEGVYAVFYFAGHGFAHEGQHFCMPWNVGEGFRLDECLCLEYVQAEIQKCRPALCFMMAEICRQEYTPSAPSPRVPTYQPEVHGNNVVWYATSYTQKAWETKQVPGGRCPRGRFSLYALEVLGRDQPLTELSTLFLSEFQLESDFYGKKYAQHPECRSNLGKKLRLTDPVDDEGHEEQGVKLDVGSKVPPKKGISFEELGVKLELRFHADLSNVLEIHTSFVEQGQCADFSISIDRTGGLTDLTIENTSPRVIRVSGLQRLKTDSLRATFTMRLALWSPQRIAGQALEHKYVSATETVDLGRPATSNLEIWRTMLGVASDSRRHPTELEEIQLPEQ